MPKANPHESASRSFLILAFALFVLAALVVSYFMFRAPQTPQSPTSLGTATLHPPTNYGQIPLSFEANHDQNTAETAKP